MPPELEHQPEEPSPSTAPPDPAERSARAPALLGSLWGLLRAHDSHRQWAIDANDGVIATAGLLTRLLEGDPAHINREGASGAFRH